MEDSARDQPMAYLDFIKSDMQSHGNFANHKLAVAFAFLRCFSFDVDKDVFMLLWLKAKRSNDRFGVRMVPKRTDRMPVRSFITSYSAR